MPRSPCCETIWSSPAANISTGTRKREGKLSLSMSAMASSAACTQPIVGGPTASFGATATTD